MIHFIGVYDYTVVLTYLSLFSASLGMIQAGEGRFTFAVLCLMFSGLCDAFDGVVARSKKKRTEEERSFGIQLDSLVDVVSFGILPAFLCHYMGVQGVLGFVLICFYLLCAVARLAFFNVLETTRQRTETGCCRSYRGLPVTSISILFPLLYLLRRPLSAETFTAVLYGMLPVMGFLFILDFCVPKVDIGKLLTRKG